MADPAVAADVGKAFDVTGNFAAQIAFDFDPDLIDRVADALLIFFRHIFNAQIRTDPGVLDQTLRRPQTDAKNIRQRNFDAFVARKIDTSDTSH